MPIAAAPPITVSSTSRIQITQKTILARSASTQRIARGLRRRALQTNPARRLDTSSAHT